MLPSHSALYLFTKLLSPNLFNHRTRNLNVD